MAQDDPLPEWPVVQQAHQALVALGVESTFAWKLLIGLPRDPLLVQLIKVQEVLQCSYADLVLWLTQLRQLSHPSVRTIPYIAGQRDALLQAFQDALTQVEAQMPAFWPWLITHSRTGRKGRPSEPTARLFMALVDAHLRQHDKPVDYAKLATIVKQVFPKAIKEDLTSTEAAASVRVKCNRFWKGLDRADFLAAIEQLRGVIN